MQIHEITLTEAGIAPADPNKILATRGPATRFKYGAPPATAPAASATTQSRARAQAAPAQKSPIAQPTTGAGAFGQIAQQLQQPVAPAGPTQSSTQGTITPTATGLVHTASERNPNPRIEPMSAQQKWDIEFRKLQNQFPGRTPQQYQQAMLQRTGMARPDGAPTTQAAPIPQQQAPQTAATVAQPGATIRSAPRPAQPAPAAPTQYPPITLGTGPKAQTYVNKGRGYVDSKTGKPMPPSIVKALNIQ